MTDFREMESDHEDNSANDEYEMSAKESLEVISGILSIISMRLQSDLQTKNEIWNLYNNAQYVELIAFMRILKQHYIKSDAGLSTSFDQIIETLDPLVIKERVSLDSDTFLQRSLNGVFGYFKCCFRDNKLNNSDETSDRLYREFVDGLFEKNYFKLYGMLLGCQEQFQQPDKSLIFDIMYEHIIGLCPELN
jgi:hypothetical protein